MGVEKEVWVTYFVAAEEALDYSGDGSSGEVVSWVPRTYFFFGLHKISESENLKKSRQKKALEIE